MDFQQEKPTEYVILYNFLLPTFLMILSGILPFSATYYYEPKYIMFYLI